MELQSARRFEVATTFEVTQLIAPIIGSDFVAGLDAELSDWVCFSLQIVRKISSKPEADIDLPILRRQEIPMAEFMKTIEQPMRVITFDQAGASSAFNILAIDGNFLVAENNNLIPVQSILKIRMLGANQ